MKSEETIQPKSLVYLFNESFSWWERLYFPIRRVVVGVYDWVRYRTIRRYHIPHCSLKPGYCDHDMRILNVIFEEVSHFVETDAKNIQWTGSDGHDDAYTVFSRARDWWRIERPAAEKQVEELYASCEIMTGWNDVPDEWKQAGEVENNIRHVDKAMAESVIKHIYYLWY